MLRVEENCRDAAVIIVAIEGGHTGLQRRDRLLLQGLRVPHQFHDLSLLPLAM